MLSGKIAVQNENRTKPVMQDFHYFLPVVNTYTSRNYRNHDTLNVCRHITAYTPFRDIPRQTQLLETHHGKHNLYRCHHGTHRIYEHIMANTTFTDTWRHTQNSQTHYGTHNLYKHVTAHTTFTDTSRQKHLQTHHCTQKVAGKSRNLGK